ncbi:hypothetical protein OO013_00465 [Mangrovivirga sp. M17]|uniref:Uncharacterized protein n=1 Tax=Mangrovivirga halotolerans TaxID=2993936 RepID=A0ABT3RLG7_9BACT|nr:hypothetical protein [Mangrovivirga halotolerans]MCX2742311.1 hypothetical protein [Mangrovivirga halotolerans]
MDNQENDHLPLVFDDIIFLKEDDIDFHLTSGENKVPDIPEESDDSITEESSSVESTEPETQESVESMASSEEIVVEAEQTSPEIPEADSPALYEGGNKKAVSIYASQLSDPEKAFLIKVISAVNLNMEDIALTTEIDSLFMIEPQEVVISFGSEELLQGPFAGQNLYEVDDVGDVKSLLCDKLETVAANKELKMKLWQGLKEIFN